MSSSVAESDSPKTLRTLGDVFEEKSFGTAILVLMVLPATPLPTGGVTHVFEAITFVLGVEMVLGRRTVDAGALEAAGARRRRDRPGDPLMMRWVRGSSGSRAHAGWGCWNRSGCAGARRDLRRPGGGGRVAPPFSGLDTLPSLGAVSIALAIILEDIALIGVGIFLGTIGVVLIVTIGATIVHVLRGLI